MGSAGQSLRHFLPGTHTFSFLQWSRWRKEMNVVPKLMLFGSAQFAEHYSVAFMSVWRTLFAVQSS